MESTYPFNNINIDHFQSALSKGDRRKRRSNLEERVEALVGRELESLDDANSLGDAISGLWHISANSLGEAPTAA